MEAELAPMEEQQQQQQHEEMGEPMEGEEEVVRSDD
jgi:hypothetical protein